VPIEDTRRDGRLQRYGRPRSLARARAAVDEHWHDSALDEVPDVRVWRNRWTLT
jgi:hypothetical protein